MGDETVQPRAYESPAVIYESVLEVRAGSPLGIPDPLDVLGMGDTQP